MQVYTYTCAATLRLSSRRKGILTAGLSHQCTMSARVGLRVLSIFNVVVMGYLAHPESHSFRYIYRYQVQI